MLQLSDVEASEAALSSVSSVVALDGRWLRINEAYCRMLGCEPEELVGASFRDITHPDDVNEDREFVAAASAGGLDSSDREKRYVCKDGSVLWARVRAELIRDEAGEPLYFVSHVFLTTRSR